MKLRLHALALAAAFSVSGAHAEMLPGTAANQGNSSVVFIAVDINSNIALTVDLGLRFADFAASDAFTGAGGSDITWDFSANSTTLDLTGNDWSTAYDAFKSTQAGNDFVWAVVAADQVTGAASATNAIAGRGLLATGNATVAEMLAAATSSPTGNAIGNFNNWVAATNNFGNHREVAHGASTVTAADGFAWTPDLMGEKFGGWLTWSYMLMNGESSTLQWQQQLAANPLVHQFGNPMTTDALSPAPGTFTFDIATNQLVWAAPVPEPGTYAMLLAGLGAVGFVARRRKG